MSVHPPSSIHQTDAPGEYWFAEGCFILECLNHPAEPAVSVARARVLPGSTTRWHRLHGITERYVIQAGHGTVEVQDLPPTRVGPGAVVIIAPGAAQRIHNEGSEDLIFLAVCTPRFVPDCYESVDGPGRA